MAKYCAVMDDFDSWVMLFWLGCYVLVLKLMNFKQEVRFLVLVLYTTSFSYSLLKLK